MKELNEKQPIVDTNNKGRGARLRVEKYANHSREDNKSRNGAGNKFQFLRENSFRKIKK